MISGDEYAGMISYEDGLARVLAAAWQVENERVALEHGLGRTLAQDAVSDMDMPPFDKSAVDGYACRSADISGELAVVGTIPAGIFPDRAVGPGEAVKIMTGAPRPEGADCVVMKEHVEALGTDRIRVTPAHGGRKNYCPRGEDVKAGSVVLRTGTRLAAQHLAILASVGVTEPLVARKVRVGVFSTGTELVAPDATPGPGQIRNSNSTQISALAASSGCEVVRYGNVEDERGALLNTVRRAMQENDIVVSTGGVSVGDYDLMPEIYTGVGAEILVRKVAIQPGKPIVFAVAASKAFFGLSGNPTSSFLQFMLFAVPFIRALSGVAPETARLGVPLAQELKRKHTERMQWFPVAYNEDGRAAPVEFHGSAHIHSLAWADGLAAFPVGVDTLREGELVRVLPLP